MNDQYAIGVSTSSMHHPMISLYANENIPCINMDDYSVVSPNVASNSRPSFILEKAEYVRKCPNEQEDLRYRQLQAPATSEKDYFRENGILKILNNLTDNQYYSRHNKFHDPTITLDEKSGASDLDI